MFWISGVSTIITASLGLVGNFLSMMVLTREVMSSIFNKLLLSLCLADLVFLLSSLAMSPIALQYYTLYPVPAYHAAECLCHLSLAVSVFLTATISIERHQVWASEIIISKYHMAYLKAVCLPHIYRLRVQVAGPNSLIANYVLPSILLAYILNIQK